MADKPSAIDTGPGGFDLEGKTYTFDVGLTEKDGGSQGPRKETVNVNSGYVGNDGKPKDLTKKTKTSLSQYLSDVTAGKKGAAPVANRYPVSAQPQAETSISHKDGTPVGPSPVGDSNSNAFALEIPTTFSEQYPELRPHLKKGKDSAASGDALDGNDFLKSKAAIEPSIIGVPDDLLTSIGIKPPGRRDTTPIGRYQSAVMTKNRFTEDSAFLDVEKTDAGFNPALSKQSQSGRYDPGAEKVALGRLAAIGPLLTMRAGKELGAANPGADPTSGGLQAQALLPGVGQIGIERIDQVMLLASDVLANLTETDNAVNPFVISPGSLSWGQLNNVNDPYSGTDALGMLALSTALVAAVELVFDALSIILGLITPQLKKPAKDAQGRYSLGEYLPGSKAANKQNSGGIGGAVSALGSLNFASLLGIQPTNFPFSRALTAGMNAFFQVPDSEGGGIGLNQLAGAVTSSIDSPGFNVVVCRAIIRSSLTIVDQLKKIGGNPMNAINQILALIDTIRTSKVISACNTFATLGDAILTLPKNWVDQQASGGAKVSQMDQVDNALTNAVIKNRLRGSLKLAWASNRAPANLLLPASIIGPSYTASGMGQFDDKLGVQSDPLSRLKTSVISDSSKNRIDPGDAAIFESKFDAEYVPFYFHDVRTNEMVGFHAFLASLTDDYTASYDKSEGFGRVEGVKIYKSTERRIGMSFYIVATSPKDFDEMWVKINKLVTLVYPQYTSGVQVQDKDGNFVFTQPFSQLVGASPLVRIRLGDLLRSNYSRFALARLFGLGNKTFTVNGKTDDSSVDEGILKAYQASLGKAFQSPNSETYYVAPGSYSFIEPPSPGGGLTPPTPKLPGSKGDDSGPKFAPQFQPHVGAVPGLFVIKAKSVAPDPKSSGGGISVSIGGGGGGSSPPAGDLLLVCEVQLNDDPTYKKVFPEALVAAAAEFGAADKLLQKYIGGTYLIPASALTPTKKTKADLMAKAGAAASGGFASELSDFMNPEKNAIAKSFQDTGGKGLAGFIETMSFDWFDKVTWEIDPDRTAPKICKVTIAFSPIHDITPGIDHLGFNRAPVYPVGLMAQGDDTTAPGSGGN